MLLGDPQPHVGRAGDQSRVRMGGARLGEARRVDRREPVLAVRCIVERRVARNASSCAASRSSSDDTTRLPSTATPARASRSRRTRSRRSRPCASRRRGSGGSRCSGTGCPTAHRRRPRATARARSCRARTGSSRSPACRSRTATPWHSTIACCTGCSAPSGAASDSTVNTALPSSDGSEPDAGVDRLPGERAVAASSSPTTTVHAPQSPSAQPSLVPVSWRVSRSHCEQRGLRGHAGDVHPLAVQHEADRVHRRVSPGACQSGMAFSRYIAARTPLGRPSLPIERRKMPSISPVT